MIVYDVGSLEFEQYGRIIKDIDFSDLIIQMDMTEIPQEVVYVPSDKGLERTASCNVLTEKVFGNMQVQIGYCNGHNSKLNALEYHKSSEINIAVTDMILLLGRLQDVEEDYSYDTSKVVAFKVPKGVAVEIYSTTLHYAPCSTSENGFKCVVVLPRGTNMELDNTDAIKTGQKSVPGEAGLLFAVNKWLIAHEEAEIEGAFIGLKGENITCA